MSKPAGGWTDAFLDSMRIRGDPVGDRTAETLREGGVTAVQEANRMLARLGANGAPPDFSGASPAVAAALNAFIAETRALPPWADPARIERAERVFFDHGLIVVSALFYASLPETYVPPSLAKVLHVAGQLQAHTERRIRETARMIFTVMASGGLTRPEGTGVSNTQRVRLIHAMIRREILRGNPADVVAAGGTVAPAPSKAPATDMTSALATMGWSTETDGVPIDQEELAFTLLTFSYVGVRSMKALGVALSKEDEEAYLHCWNVAGSVLGIVPELMADTMADAHELFERIKARALRQPKPSPDPRQPLARALTDMIERVVAKGPLKPIAVLLPRKLLGPETTDLLGIDTRVSPLAHFLFDAGLSLVWIAEAVGRVLVKDLVVVRMLHRIVAHHLLESLLMDQTRPLRLPPGVLNPLVISWENDRAHPEAINRFEATFSSEARASIRRAAT